MADRKGRIPGAKGGKGEKPPFFVNVFKGLLNNPLDGGKYFALTRLKKGNGKRNLAYRVLINKRGWEAAGPSVSFNFDVFEYVILSRLQEISPKEITGGGTGHEEMEKLIAERDKKQLRLQEIVEAMVDKEEGIAALSQASERLGKHIEDLEKRIAQLRRKRHMAASQEWNEGMTLAAAVLHHPDSMERRRRLRAVFYRALEGIWAIMGTVQNTDIRFCVAQVYFRDSQLVRTYAIYYKQARRIAKAGVQKAAEFAFRTWKKADTPANLKEPAAACALKTLIEAGYRLPKSWDRWPPEIQKNRGGKRES